MTYKPVICERKHGIPFLALLWFGGNSKARVFFCNLYTLNFLPFLSYSSVYSIFAFPTPSQCCMAWFYFQKEAHFNFVSGISAYPHVSLETSVMVPTSRLLLPLCNVKHHSIPAPWSCMFVSRLRSPLALPTWYSANPVWHLLLSLGRGPRQASSSFISWVLSAASKLWSPVLKASEVPSMVEWGTEPREVYKQRVLWKVN